MKQDKVQFRAEVPSKSYTIIEKDHTIEFIPEEGAGLQELAISAAAAADASLVDSNGKPVHFTFGLDSYVIPPNAEGDRSELYAKLRDSGGELQTRRILSRYIVKKDDETR